MKKATEIVLIILILSLVAGCNVMSVAKTTTDESEYISQEGRFADDGKLFLLPVAVLTDKGFEEENERGDHNMLDAGLVASAMSAFPENTVIPVTRAMIANVKNGWGNFSDLVTNLDKPEEFNSMTNKKMLQSVIDIIQKKTNIDAGHVLLVTVNGDKSNFANSSNIRGQTSIINLNEASLRQATTMEHEYLAAASTEASYVPAVTLLIKESLDKVKIKAEKP